MGAHDAARTSDRDRLEALETRIAKTICNGGSLARGESEEADRLRRIVGAQYDAINQKWCPLEAHDASR